jgi:hypothetical protein
MNYRSHAAIMLAALLTGCGVMHSTPDYVTSRDNFFMLRDLKGQQLNVGAFSTSAPDKEVGCRAVSIAPPNGKTFSEYVRVAFVRELGDAGLYSASAPVTLTGNLDMLELASMTGSWTMTLTLKSSNSRSMKVSSKTDFNFVWDGKTACHLAATEFVRATQSLVGKAISAPEFAELIR